MAIYSLRMSAIGKTTQEQPFTAAAHLKYITRKDAVTAVLAARMPDSRKAALAWLRREEREDRKNARIIDKVMVALPRELTSVQQHALVKAFAEALTRGRASWLAAFHTKGKDRSNPHCHLILRDRDPETGRRVMFLSAGKKEAAERAGKGRSAPTTLAAVRELWERMANAALAASGRTERIDRRSLKAQGQRRRAQVHEGPNIRAMHARGFRPASRDRVVRSNPHRRRGRTATRIVRYAVIDKGLTRVQYNQSLRQELRDGVSLLPGGREVARPFPAPVAASSPPRPDLVPAARPINVPPVSPPVQPPPVPTHPTPGRKLTLTERLALQHGIEPVKPRGDQDRGRGR